MRKSQFTEAQMVSILREADGAPVAELAKAHGVSALMPPALSSRPRYFWNGRAMG